MGLDLSPGISVFGTPVAAREFRCVGSITKWNTTDVSAQHTLYAGSQAHSLNVPRGAFRRNIWLDFDALRSGSIAPWYLSGRLGFYINGSKITEFPISKGYGTWMGQSGINIFAPSTGAGQQPALRATAWENYAQDYKSVDMPCFTFDVECDEITLDIDAISLGGPYLVMTDIQLATIGDMTYTQANSDLYACIKSSAGTNRLGADGVSSPFPGFFTFATAAARCTDIKSKTAVRLANATANWNDQTTPPTITFDESGGGTAHKTAGTIAPTFVASWDGIANLMTGIIVASQYPGGL